MLFDTHAHLDQDEFDADRDEVVARAVAAGVTDTLAVGTTVATSEKCVALAANSPHVHAAVGIQPNYVHEAGHGDWDAIVRLSSAPGVVALGETGLDRYWDDAPFALQQDYFDRHLRLSQQTRLPFIVHMRDCEADVLAMLREAANCGPLRGVMHSFTGDWPMAAECLALGLDLSFAGMVTYKKSQPLRDVAARVPLDRLLVETDSPYLSPEPVRKVRRNEPAHVVHTARLLAEVRGISLEELAAATTANARRLFGV
ncbi:MAG: TatD family hydrolase [Pirellulales bacterium]|nr:TatD family hydrolase [Pirellulales bacterium]